MYVWAGLLVALASSLVASASKIKYPKQRTFRWKKFAIENRFALLTAVLALMGFGIAALGVHESKSRAAAEKQELTKKNEELQTLILADKSVSPTIRFMWDTQNPSISENFAAEEIRWDETRDAAELPRAIGFFPSTLRSHVFPAAEGENTFGYLGSIEFRTGLPSIRPSFRVRRDGAIRSSGLRSSKVHRVAVNVYQSSIVSFDTELPERIDASVVFQSLVLAYENERSPLVIHAYGVDDSHQVVKKLSSRFKGLSGKLTVFLNAERTLGVTSLLRGRAVSAQKSSLIFEWDFTQRPYIDHISPGGRG